jgi:hypothetical protein
MSKSKYATFAAWGHMSATEYRWNSAILSSSLEAFIYNIDRIRAMALMHGAIAAHAMSPKSPALPDGVKTVEHYIDHIDAVRDGMQGMFYSAVIASWTAFESLATDLWVNSLNHRPKSLGMSALKAQRRKSDDDESNVDNLGAISVDVLAKYDFDLRERIGYYLWREQVFKFNNLSSIRSAYKAAFGKQAKEWFNDEKFDKDLPTVEALRHVLAHRGGIIDDRFLDRVKSKPHLSHLVKDQKIVLDGDAAAKSAEVAFVCGFTLADHVDEWLEVNPS